MGKVTALRPKGAQPTQDETPAATIPLQVVLILTVDGKPAHHIALEAQIEPPADGQGAGVAWPIDARKLAALLETITGPATPKLWTPGQ